MSKPKRIIPIRMSRNEEVIRIEIPKKAAKSKAFAEFPKWWSPDFVGFAIDPTEVRPDTIPLYTTLIPYDAHRRPRYDPGIIWSPEDSIKAERSRSGSIVFNIRNDGKGNRERIFRNTTGHYAPSPAQLKFDSSACLLMFIAPHFRDRISLPPQRQPRAFVGRTMRSYI